MAFTSALLALALLGSAVHGLPQSPFDQANANGYFMPSRGTASTTTFSISSEFGGGTACGVNNFPGGALTGGDGKGPGVLYAAINQLGFGTGASGGPGPACGVCYQLTPPNGNSLVFMIVDSCPVTAKDGPHCGQCSVTSKNPQGQTWHFDIAADGMNPEQYAAFYQGAIGGTNFDSVTFQTVPCPAGPANAPPEINPSYGCVSGNCVAKTNTGPVCAGTVGGY